MKLFPGEREVMSTNGDILVLTTHRVRVESQQVGRAHVVSITLDAVASCGIETRSYPWLLGFAALLTVIPFVQSPQSRTGGLWLIAALLVAGYFITRSARLTVASAGGVIAVPVTGMSHNELVGFVDAVERQKLLVLGHLVETRA